MANSILVNNFLATKTSRDLNLRSYDIPKKNVGNISRNTSVTNNSRSTSPNRSVASSSRSTSPNRSVASSSRSMSPNRSVASSLRSKSWNSNFSNNSSASSLTFTSKISQPYKKNKVSSEILTSPGNTSPISTKRSYVTKISKYSDDDKKFHMEFKQKNVEFCAKLSEENQKMSDFGKKLDEMFENLKFDEIRKRCDEDLKKLTLISD